MTTPRFTVQQYGFAFRPVAWHVLRDGQIIDTYDDLETANAYCAYMNDPPAAVTISDDVASGNSWPY